MLINQGTLFMSKVIADLYKLFQIKKSRTLAGRKVTFWNCLLPALIFAIRKVPQEFTGFSPFKLVYMQATLWVASQHKTVVEHINRMGERIAKVMSLVKAHLQKTDKSVQWATKLEQFQAGDQMAVLIPIMESNVLNRWHGPYKMVEKISEVNSNVH